jgi:hypothetical protein
MIREGQKTMFPLFLGGKPALRDLWDDQLLLEALIAPRLWLVTQWSQLGTHERC